MAFSDATCVDPIAAALLCALLLCSLPLVFLFSLSSRCSVSFVAGSFSFIYLLLSLSLFVLYSLFVLLHLFFLLPFSVFSNIISCLFSYYSFRFLVFLLFSSLVFIVHFYFSLSHVFTFTFTAFCITVVASSPRPSFLPRVMLSSLLPSCLSSFPSTSLLLSFPPSRPLPSLSSFPPFHPPHSFLASRRLPFFPFSLPPSFSFPSPVSC